MNNNNLCSLLSTYIKLFLLFVCFGTLTACSNNYESIDNYPELKKKFKSAINDWQGSIDTEPGQQAPIILHLKNSDSGLNATIDSPLQNAFGIPLVIQVDRESKSIVLTNEQLDLILVAEYQPKQIKGEIIVAGRHFAITMMPQSTAQNDVIADVNNRPQTPTPPFNYQIEERVITIGNDSLASTLTIPNGKGPFPAVLLVTGTGPDNRDYSKLGHKRFWVLADFLTSQGIAVLRYDERGVGQSTGRHSLADFSDFSNDIERLLEELTKHHKIDQNKLGIIGHSEGAMLAAMNASRLAQVDFIVMLAGMMDSEIGLSLQYKDIATAFGYSPDTFVSAVRELEELAVSGEEMAALVEHYKNHYEESMPLPKGMLQQTANHFTTPSMKSFLNFKPEVYLTNIAVPVLSLCGELDRYFDCLEHSKALNDLFKHDREALLTSIKYDNLNHYFQTAKSGTMAEEPSLQETLSPKVMSDISQWIHSQN